MYESFEFMFSFWFKISFIFSPIFSWISNISFAKAYQAEIERLNHLFAGHKLITVNNRYLGSYVDNDGNSKSLVEAIQQHSVALLRSGMGSGKTEVVRDLTKVESKLTSAYISPRITLCGYAAAR